MWGGAFFGVEPVNDVIDVDFASLMHVEELQQSTAHNHSQPLSRRPKRNTMPQRVRTLPDGYDTGPHTVYTQRFGSNGVC